MTFTPTPITVKDGAAADKPLIAYNDGTSSAFAHPVLDNTGAIISPATAGNQASANTKLDTIIANTGPGSVSLSLPLMVTVGDYTSGMVVGGKLSVTNATRLGGGSGIIQQASINKKTDLIAPFDLFIFHTDPTTVFTDQLTLPDFSADFSKLAGVIHCNDLVDCGTPQILQALQQALAFKLLTGTTLFVVPVVRDNETYASTNALTLNLAILRD